MDAKGLIDSSGFIADIGAKLGIKGGMPTTGVGAIGIKLFDW